MHIGYQQLADSLSTVPQERLVDKTGEMDVTASGSSQPPAIDQNQPGLSLVQATTDTEQADMVQPEDSLVSNSFTLSGAATPAQNEPDNGISQMEAADIESELNNLLSIDNWTYSPITVIEPSPDPEPLATASNQDSGSNPPEE